MKFCFVLILCTLPLFGFAQERLSAKDELAIRKVMAMQEAAWNSGNLEEFMEGYWQADSLTFVGKRGLTYGWDQTLANYQRSYPDRQAMGTLNFRLLRLQKAGKRYAYVVGRWELQRERLEDLMGHFSLLWEKQKGKWIIVADHSS
ncbi:MAG: DUF4440 domain-containing protein [Bacteroidota bacterium]